MQDEAARTLWAPRAWIGDGWQDRVHLTVGPQGLWTEVRPGSEPAPGSTVLAGAVLPGLVDAHSHAFQRAFAGLAERRQTASDDFWAWRDRMYGVALRITPGQLRAIAAHLFLELLRGGYTQVCEFHYLQHAPDGTAYADPLELSWALCDAAGDAGIGLTMLPVLYERAGFSLDNLRDDQRRFATSASSVVSAQRALQSSGRSLVNAGMAIHSLRAAAPASIHSLLQMAEGLEVPLHIHVAEQIGEVEECLAATGSRPIEWLAKEGLLDSRWQLVHATHSLPSELDAVAASGAGVVLCPSTEANLGDGLPDLPGWLAAEVPLSLGSDSQVTRDWREELRWLDYGQRLAKRRRNVSAAPEKGMPSTASRLLSRVQAGGARAAGFKTWGITPGARADLLVIPANDPSVLGIPSTHLLDALVFSSPGHAWREVMVAGRWVVRDGAHLGGAEIAGRFENAMKELWP